MQLRILSAADLRAVLDMPTAIDAVARAFAALSAGRARAPLRTVLEVEGGVTLVMPGWVAGVAVTGAGTLPHTSRERSGSAPDESPAGRTPPALAAKIVSVFGGNPARGLPAVNAVVLVLDAGTGTPRAVMEGGWLTALRTGAATGVATRHLAREDARVLAVFGAGVQARTQIEAVRAVRPVSEVRIVSRTPASADALAAELGRGPAPLAARGVADPAEALRGADLVVAATNSPRPVFPGAAVEPGTHVNGIGSYTPAMREVDGDLVARATVVVDDRQSAWAEAGDLVGALQDGRIGRDHVRADLGEVVRGVHPGRASAAEITFFKSVGNAVQDVAVAAAALERAEDGGAGTLVEL